MSKCLKTDHSAETRTAEYVSVAGIHRRCSDIWSVVWVVALVLSLVFATEVEAAEISADVSLIGDAVNIEFEGRNDWPYDISRQKNKIELLVPKMDTKARATLLSWKGPLISKIEVKGDANDRDKITFTLARQDVQTFDYLTDQPSRLIVDFFVAEEPVRKSERLEAKAPEANPAEPDTTVANVLPKKGARKPASKELLRVDEKGEESAQIVGPVPQIEVFDDLSKGVFDGSDPDFERFTIKDYEIRPEALIASQQNIYVRFPMLTNPDDSFDRLLKNTPDYQLTPDNTDENKKARLLQTLYKNKRYAVFLKTIEFFRQAYPNSKYDELIRHWEADIYHDISRRDNSHADFQIAMTKYKALLIDYPDSPLAERTHLLVGYGLQNRGDVMGSLAQLESFVRKYPNSAQVHQVKIATGDLYESLHKYDDAERVLRSVEADPTSGDYAAAAAFKRADVYIAKKDYDAALKAYSENRIKYKDLSGKFPSALYNSAEAYFWKGEYKKALDHYREFLQKYPTSSHGGYAMTRIGETLEILGADKKKVLGAYLETLFRYRGSQGAGIANVRIVRERLSGMKPKEVEANLREVHEFVTKSDLPRIKDFEVLTTADGYYDRGEYDKSLKYLTDFYQANPTSTNLDVFRFRIVKNLATKIKSSVSNGDYIGAISTYAKNLTTWLKRNDRIDLQFAIGSAYEELGAHPEAAKVYRDALNQRYAIAGTGEERERMVFEDLPSADRLNLRLAAVSMRSQDIGLTAKYLSQIKDSEKMTDEEKVERTELLAGVQKGRGDIPGAERHLQELIAHWKGQPEKLAPLYLELAKHQTTQKKFSEAEASIAKIQNFAQDTNLISPDLQASVLETQGDLLLAQGKSNQAIEAYESLLEKFESQRALGSIRYRVGKLYFEQGRLTEAEKVWSALEGNQENRLWSQMAKEQLSHARWQDDYKKYIQRIPAMSSSKENSP